MISSIHLHNFQSHKNTFIEFDKGFNVLIGESDQGKTSIMRAIEWVFYNKYFKGYKRYKEKFVKVTIKLFSGDTITRYRSSTQNYYKINNDKYSATGRSIPEKIQKLLNISDVNIQGQHDLPFLLGQTPGNTSRYLNKIIHVEEIDIAFSNIKRKISSTKSHIKSRELSIKNLTKELRSLQHIKDLHSKYVKIKSLKRRIANLKDKIDELGILISKHKKLNKQLYPRSTIKKANDSVTKYKEVLQIYDKIQLIESLTIKYTKLNNQLNTINDDILSTRKRKKTLLRRSNICPFYKQKCPLHKQRTKI